MHFINERNILVFLGQILLLPGLAQPGHEVPFSLFMATVMAISAMPVAARTLYDLNLSKTDLGFPILSALTFIVLLGVLCGAITQSSGIHALFGFFLAGTTS